MCNQEDDLDLNQHQVYGECAFKHNHCSGRVKGQASHFMTLYYKLIMFH